MIAAILTITGLATVFGLLLGLADRLGSHRYPISHLGWRDAVLFGVGQALARVRLQKLRRPVERSRRRTPHDARRKAADLRIDRFERG